VTRAGINLQDVEGQSRHARAALVPLVYETRHRGARTFLVAMVEPAIAGLDHRLKKSVVIDQP